VAINEKDKFKTAFNVPAGHYEWNVMPFGLKNAPAKFQRVMDDTLKPYFDWLIVYIDDILVFSSSIDQHFKHLKKLLQVIKQAGLVLSKKKIELFQTQLSFLVILLIMAKLLCKLMLLNLQINFQTRFLIKHSYKGFWEV
jgi:hypothetical protein